MASDPYSCMQCGRAFGAEADFSKLSRVTSDSKPFGPGGEIGQCTACGLVQKPFTPALAADLAEIYQHYSMFSQSEKYSDQAVFDALGQAEISRSARVVAWLKQTIDLPERGTLLDVGCGTGPFLSAFGQALPAYLLCAQDLDDRYEAHLKKTANFSKLYTGAVENIHSSFDVISLSHVLEHFKDPVGALCLLAEKLNPNGAILVQVPDLEENVFDLAVCDHLAHFTAATLLQTARAAGFADAHICVSRGGAVSKQLTMVLSDSLARVAAEIPAETFDLRQGIRTLQAYEDDYRQFLADHRRIALFGVATAATWFASVDASKIAYFVDEDKMRAGLTHLGIPVVSPADLPKDVPLFVALAPAKAAEAVCSRLAALGLSLHHNVPLQGKAVA